MNAMPSELGLYGRQMPACYGVMADRSFHSLDQHYGTPMLLVLLGGSAAASAAPLLAEIAALDIDALLVVDENPALFGPCLLPAMDGGGFLQRCGVGPHDVQLLVLDRALRVAAQARPAQEPEALPRCLAALRALPHETPCTRAMPAPAIVLPNLISPEMCRHLIELFECSPTMEGEVARVDAAGETHSVVDHAKKHRRDMPIAPETELHEVLCRQILTRCAPEIARAFQVHVAHLDRILLARYDDTGGYFRRHRDNSAPNVAFREFALSVNLNTHEYEGGDLLLPEYNDHRHRPPAGGGLIFSTAVLHEAAPVTRGRRYALLTFLHSDAAEQRRGSRRE
jgi:predicted 2-oxoglutarate/Fe(II)-dependent dioxygenase YbiX